MSKSPKQLTHGDPAVTLTASVVSRVCAIAEYTVPRGRGLVFRGDFRFRFKMLDAAATEMPITALFRFAIRPATETIWTYPIGAPVPYEAWQSLSLAEQKNEKYGEACEVNLGIDYLAVIEDETLLIEVYDATGTVDETYTKFFIEYAEAPPEALANFITKRRKTFAV